jgi:hypothetical protein
MSYFQPHQTRIEVVRYLGYCPSTKRGEYPRIGSINRSKLKPSNKLTTACKADANLASEVNFYIDQAKKMASKTI